MLRLLMARHGESEWQVRGDEAGSDSLLTQLGQQQAEHLGRWLAAEEIEIDQIYASPLQRAYETAQRVAAHLDLPVQAEPNLQEAWFYIAPQLPTLPSPLAPLEDYFAAGEVQSQDYWQFRRQVSRALREIVGRHPEGTVLLVAHGGTVETIFRLLLGSHTFTVNMGNTTLHSLVWQGDRWHIEYIDRWEHLRGLSD